MNLQFLRTATSRTATAVGAATIAAVVVAGSLSVAQAATRSVPDNNSVTSAKIVDNTVQGIDIKNHTITPSDLAAGVVSPPTFARVSGTGVLGVHARVSSASNPGTGIYNVTFARDVSACAPLVTPFGPGPRSAVVNPFSATVLEVELANDAGTLTNGDFSIVLIC